MEMTERKNLGRCPRPRSFLRHFGNPEEGRKKVGDESGFFGLPFG
jgi:hypothetical protein